MVVDQTNSVSKRFIFLVAGSIFIASIFFVCGWYVALKGVKLDFYHRNKTISDYLRVRELIKHEYIGEATAIDNIDQSFVDLLHSLRDPYSKYISAAEYEANKNTEAGSRIGLGVAIKMQDDVPMIVDVYAGSAAAAAGLQKGDIVTQIDGIVVSRGMSITAIQQLLRKSLGQPVDLIIARDNQQLHFKIKMASFRIPTLTFTQLSSQVGYLQIREFNQNLKREFGLIAPKLQLTSQKVIIDLRNNPGGSTDLFLADQFIRSGTLMIEAKKSTGLEKVITASGKAQFANFKLAILVNSNTASAAEVFAAAIHDNRRGIIIGENTQGKGTEQDDFWLTDGSVIQLTTGRWYTPKHKSLHNIGLTPDIIVADNPRQKNDAVLEAAEQYLSKH